MSRPYLSSSIDQLEDLFSTSQDSSQVLLAIATELGFRRTARAKELELEVMQTLDRLSSLTPRERVTSPSGNEVASGGKEELWSPPLPPPDVALPPRAHTNRPADVLAAWSALEVLSPQTYDRPSDLAKGDRAIVSISNGHLPWDRGPASSRPKQKIYFHIVLATIPAAPAFAALIDRFKDSRLERPSVKGDVVLASLLVDKEGILAGETPVSLSAFGWGLPVALGGSLKDLAAWTQQEPRLIEGLTKQLGVSSTETPVPLTWEALQRASSWLVDTLGLSGHQVSGPTFAVAHYLYYTLRIVPDPLLLNSFYLRDLAKAREIANKGELPKALSLYLGSHKPAARRDLLKDDAALEASLAPAGVPLGRWPTLASHTPALLQQAAVNSAGRLSGSSGILGVNGPPGTGKSTLLRDIVADLLTRRATAMCAFTDPTQAFKVSWTKRAKGETQELHSLDDSLRGFEMIVASSNNKAVENVSAEMPSLQAIPGDSPLRYFAPLASDLLDREAWGLMTAVLGNASNRSVFRKKFWGDSPRSLERYLKQVSGIAPREEGAPEGLAELCSAPSTQKEARDRWEHARKHFKQLSSTCATRLSKLESLRRALIELPEHREEEKKKKQQQLEASSHVDHAQSLLAAMVRDAQTATLALERCEVALSQHAQNRPSFFSLKRLFGAQAAKSWEATHGPLKHQADLAKTAKEVAVEAQSNADGLAQIAGQQAAIASQELEKACKKREATEQRCREVQIGAGAQVLDDDFLSLPHEQKQLAVPWLDSELQKLRIEVFEAAMEVHRAFIDAAAKPLLHNINALVGGNFNIPPDRQHLSEHLWSSLFLVVPVVSTTFASVERMLGRLPQETFGWLLVDEAGQATPQAVVGALLRCQRAVVVGDPQQVEPVVPLPDVLTAAVLREFDADPDKFGAPNASVQTLADEAGDYCATFDTAGGFRTVGSPLLVHRRCASPMFDISNTIAYGGLMVQAKPPKGSSIRDVLGASHWIDVIGSARDKFSPDEGQQLLLLLKTLRNNAILPDLYVVTPFVAVQDGLREMVKQDGVLQGWVDNASKWPSERIGTVHTVQGREAEVVIIVLGAPDPSQNGARQWAGATPNLLNVAVTRAKEAVYVIGNRSLWSGAGKFSALDLKLR
ncbi:DEAD/DEAH box helicase [Xanthomonas phaseoli]|uniref:DEAD/DEAH box helicase n=1 Tax=Xanthomonas phaseoli TaxID=1985254 RepID=UPI001ED8D469